MDRSRSPDAVVEAVLRRTYDLLLMTSTTPVTRPRDEKVSIRSPRPAARRSAADRRHDRMGLVDLAWNVAAVCHFVQKPWDNRQLVLRCAAKSRRERAGAWNVNSHARSSAKRSGFSQAVAGGGCPTWMAASWRHRETGRRESAAIG
jgi:hypothetical protein